MKKSLKRKLIVLSTIIVLLLCQFANHKVSSDKENEELQNKYPGECYYVHNECISVLDQGKGEDVLVLLANYKTLAPIVDFAPLIDELAKDYRVITIDGFGYGISDVSKTMRTADNIVQEIHSVLRALKVDKYTLVAHSFAYLYAMIYTNAYKEEVVGIIGLDPIIPNSNDYYKPLKANDFTALLCDMGFYRTLNFIQPNLFKPATMWVDYAYSNFQFDLISKVANINGSNANLAEEGKQMNQTIKQASNVILPKTLPMYFITSSEYQNLYETWFGEHEKYVKLFAKGKIDEVSAQHYMHWRAYRKVSVLMDKYLKSLKIEKSE